MNPTNQSVGAGVEWYDSGIGFAIPMSSIATVIERLKKNERIYPAFLGIKSEPSPSGKGVRINEVVDGTAAKKAGLSAGDVIVRINDVEVNDILELRKILGRLEAGTEVSIEYDSILEEKTITSKIKLGRPLAPKEDVSPMEPPKIR